MWVTSSLLPRLSCIYYIYIGVGNFQPSPSSWLLLYIYIYILVLVTSSLLPRLGCIYYIYIGVGNFQPSSSSWLYLLYVFLILFFFSFSFFLHIAFLLCCFPSSHCCGPLSSMNFLINHLVKSAKCLMLKGSIEHVSITQVEITSPIYKEI